MANQQLQKLIDDLKTKKFREGEAKGLISAIQAEQIKALQPVLENLTKTQAEAVTKAIQEAVKGLKVDPPKVDIPPFEIPQAQVNIPEIKVPTPKVNVTVPEVRVPEIKMPDQMNIEGWIGMMGYDKGLLANPLPVQIRDKDGNPVNLSQMVSVMGGGKADYLTIKGYSQSAFSELLNPDNRVKVELPSGSSGLTDTELRTAHLDVQQVSGAIDSVKVTGFDASVAAALIDSSGVQYSGSNPLPVTITSGGTATSASNIVDSTGVAYTGSNPVPMYMAGSPLASQGVSVLNGDGTLRDSWQISSILNSTAAALVDSSGVQYSGSNPVPVSGTMAVSGVTNSVGASVLNGDGTLRDSWQVSGIVASVAASLVDSSGVQYSGSNPVPVSDGSTAAAALSDTTSNPTTKMYGSATMGFDGTNWERIRTGSGYSDGAMRVVIATDVGASTQLLAGTAAIGSVTVNGSLNSVIAVGPTVADAVDDGSAPQKIGGIARTANPTAVAGGDIVSVSMDDLGRQLTRPLQVRDLMATAYVAVSTGTETTLLAGATGVYHDLVWITAANNSTAAVGIDIRAVTAGSVVQHLEIPANSTAGFSATVGYPINISDETGNAWTVDLPDITGTTVYVSALFTKET